MAREIPSRTVSQFDQYPKFKDTKWVKWLLITAFIYDSLMYIWIFLYANTRGKYPVSGKDLPLTFILQLFYKPHYAFVCPSVRLSPTTFKLEKA